MADAQAGDDTAVVLLRALPTDAAEAVLGRLDGPVADRLRGRLAAPADPPADAEVDAALTAYFDLERIAGRPAVAAGEYRPVASPPVDLTPADPADEIKALAPDRLARALSDEQPATIALILSRLDMAAVGQVMKLLPAELRADLVVRMSRPAPSNPAVVEQLTRAVAEKGRRLAAAPPEPTADQRAEGLAEILRALPRPDRNPVLARLEAADAEVAAAVRDRLYRIEDVLRVPNRQLQLLLIELDVKVLALALKGVEPAVRNKVTANMSSRAREVLNEESELLGDATASAMKEARTAVLAVLRRLEEEGKVTIEE